MKTLAFWSNYVVLLMLCATVAPQCFDENDVASETNSTGNTVLMDGFNDFATNLFKRTVDVQNSSKSYVFVSPMSAWTALTILYLGAQDPTRSELGTALGFGLMTKTTVAKQVMDMRERYFSGQRRETNGAVFMENSIYVQEDEPVHDCIMKVLHLDMDVMKVDVTADASLRHVINGINALVDHQTRGQIDELIPLEYVDPATRLLIMNTASFYGYWQHQFRPGHTRPEKFFPRTDHSIIVDTMHQNGSFQFANSSALACALVELPYLNSDVSMVVLLPHADAADDLLANLNATALEDALGEMQPRPVSLALPKLQIEQAMELKPALAEMGLATLFDPQRANLTGYSDKAGFALKDIRHLPFIEFNERGTTELDEIPQSLATPPFTAEDPTPFTVNRPFVFLLRHTGLKKTLFIGLTREPML